MSAAGYVFPGKPALGNQPWCMGIRKETMMSQWVKNEFMAFLAVVMAHAPRGLPEPVMRFCVEKPDDAGGVIREALEKALKDRYRTVRWAEAEVLDEREIQVNYRQEPQEETEDWLRPLGPLKFSSPRPYSYDGPEKRQIVIVWFRQSVTFSHAEKWGLEFGFKMADIWAQRAYGKSQFGCSVLFGLHLWYSARTKRTFITQSGEPEHSFIEFNEKRMYPQAWAFLREQTA